MELLAQYEFLSSTRGVALEYSWGFLAALQWTSIYVPETVSNQVTQVGSPRAYWCLEPSLSAEVIYRWLTQFLNAGVSSTSLVREHRFIALEVT